MTKLDPQLHLIKRLADYERLPLTVYHYTTEAALEGILGTRSIWATDVRDFADPREFTYTLDLVRDRLAAQRERRQGQTADLILLEEWGRGLVTASTVQYYVTSFSVDRDSPSQWRTYGCPPGYALGIDQMHLLFIARACPRAMLVECVYDRTTQIAAIDYALAYLLDSYRQRLDHGLPNRALLEEFGTHFFGHVLYLATRFKRPQFAGEREWRLAVRSPDPGDAALDVKTRRRDGTDVRYIEVPIATESRPTIIGKLIVGPTTDRDRSMARAKEILSTHGYEPKELAGSVLEP
jgi:hypothetical protein